jgi:hypothetical protein
MLLSCVHCRYLWLGRTLSIDTEMIVKITGFPMEGEDPSILFTDKSNEKALSKKMKENFGTFRATRRFNIASINDNCAKFAMQVLS